MAKQTQTQTQNPAARYQNVMCDSDALAGLDALIGASLQAGYRPGGRRPSRAAIIADLVARACDALHGPQQPPGAALGLPPASAAPAAPQAPQEPAEAALPLAQSTAPRCVAPHYFAMHGEVR